MSKKPPAASTSRVSSAVTSKLTKSSTNSTTRLSTTSKRRPGSGKSTSQTSLANSGSRANLGSRSVSRASVRPGSAGENKSRGRTPQEGTVASVEDEVLKEDQAVPDVEEIPAVNEEAEYRKRVEALPVPFEVLKRGLSNLGRSPEELKQVYTKLSIPNANISQISFLQNYRYLQILELPGNSISDTSTLSHLRYLTHLDLSGNKLTKALDFDPPYNLQHVDLSKNQITEIGQMGRHRFLARLCLDRNLIRTISGLEDCRYLTHLSLRNNGILMIEGLEGLPIRYLDLRYNRIASLEGLATLGDLEDLYIGHNCITSLTPLPSLPSLRLIDLSFNNLNSIDSLAQLQVLIHLRDLYLSDNPLTNSPSYRLRTVFLLSQLTVLDALPVSPEEKVAAINKYDPPPSVVASVHHAAMLKRQIRREARINKVDIMEGDGSGGEELELEALVEVVHPGERCSSV
ncbi:uncharacterized protein SPPG_07175 [Spizellomyces punctatus DAOM BR117]|uniref:L domain-like protein n=1 Tax=Spizellomyces punctatus (strain DAOM BR117) TaxID=645134 RepID=A0A0L0HAI8_SPIPD|nr:uncharacterized protein SPPG_07175 [Spizellomyces punctatus DAOM BR117]KNC97713.1 hypothetical protein SPPG_07175 [Spizellomyces punctatus DAOM BR117]|eukprot:XP_016605753.1 hypothetical protein SPPG_07175 [Spizellomyces punctatus DAOM BR117]